jgi:aminopeptidase N
MGRGLVWPQQLTITVGYGGDVKTVPVDMRAATATLPGVEGRERPRFVLPNGGGLGYGLFVLDDVSRAYLVDHVEQLPDPLTRGSAWVTLWDNLLEGAVAAPALFDTALRALPSETDEQNVQRILGYAARMYWRFLTAPQRQARAARLETVLRDGLARAATQSQKSAWFNACRDTVISAEGVAWLERVWRRRSGCRGSRWPSRTRSRWRWSWRCAKCRGGRRFSTRSSRGRRTPIAATVWRS